MKKLAKIYKICAVIAAAVLLFGLTSTTVSAAFPTNPKNSVKVGVVQHNLRAGDETPAGNYAATLQPESNAYNAPLFDMGALGALYPGESLESDLRIENGGTVQTVRMTIRVTPQNTPGIDNDRKLNEIVWLTVKDGSTIIYDDIVPVSGGSDFVYSGFTFSPGQAKTLDFKATLIGGEDIFTKYPNIYSQLSTNLDKWIEFTKEYMDRKASFQVLFQITTTTPTTTSPYVPTTGGGDTPTTNGDPFVIQPTTIAQPVPASNTASSTVQATTSATSSEEVQPTTVPQPTGSSTGTTDTQTNTNESNDISDATIPSGSYTEGSGSDQPSKDVNPDNDAESFTEKSIPYESATVHMPKTGEDFDPLMSGMFGFMLIFAGSIAIVGVKKSKKNDNEDE